MFIIVLKKRRKKLQDEKNTYIFTQDLKPYCIRDFVLAFVSSVSPLYPCRAQHNSACKNEKEYFEMVQNRLFYNSVLLRIFLRIVYCKCRVLA